MLSEHEEQPESEAEGLSLYFTHRLSMLSLSGFVVSLIGLLYFSFAKSKSQSFFGTSIGIFECVVFLLISVVVLVFVLIDYKVREDEKKNREFCGFAIQIDDYRKSLRNCAYGVAGFQSLRDDLLTFSVIMRSRYEINCPIIPRFFHAPEWEKTKEEWRIFLDNLYLGTQMKSIERTRELLEEQYDVFPNINAKNEKEEITT